jgi:hypothetical protein
MCSMLTWVAGVLTAAVVTDTAFISTRKRGSTLVVMGAATAGGGLVAMLVAAAIGCSIR